VILRVISDNRLEEGHSITAPHIIDPTGLLGDALAEASPDLMRSLLQTTINALLSADADAVVGAEYGRPSPERTAQRNGYRHRPLDTRVGTIKVAEHLSAAPDPYEGSRIATPLPGA